MNYDRGKIAPASGDMYIDAPMQETYPSIRESLNMLQKYQQESYEILSQYNDLVLLTTGINLHRLEAEKKVNSSIQEPNLCKDIYETVQMSQHINTKLHNIIQQLNKAL